MFFKSLLQVKKEHFLFYKKVFCLKKKTVLNSEKQKINYWIHHNLNTKIRFFLFKDRMPVIK